MRLTLLSGLFGSYSRRTPCATVIIFLFLCHVSLKSNCWFSIHLQSNLRSQTNSLSDDEFPSESETHNITDLLLSKFQHLFQSEKSHSSTTPAPVNAQQSGDARLSTIEPQGYDESPSPLETRKLEQHNKNKNDATEHRQAQRHNFIRILNKVFSRVSLPETFKHSATPSRSRSGSLCLHPHVGCLDVLPNLPSLLRKTNVSTKFTIYTSSQAFAHQDLKGVTGGQKISFEPLMHYQLDVEDSNRLSESDFQTKLKLEQTASPLRHDKRVTLASSLPLPSSWQSVSKILHSQEYPFDLAALESSGFNSSQATRVIIGGYFAKDDEEWIDEVVKQWLLLDPSSNVIKVSWADSNRGLYHAAAYNSRVVGRQLTLLLHYLDQMFHIDFNKFHLVGHSLGAHIAGYVGADSEGRIARITGLDPAGPIFSDLNTSLRLDPSDAKYVDVVHTNAGSINRASFGLTLPSGHVDYYPNGGSAQPGCMMSNGGSTSGGSGIPSASSVSASIAKWPFLDPVERVACNHRRSYRYFIELIKLAIQEKSLLQVAQRQHLQHPSADNNDSPATDVYESYGPDFGQCFNLSDSSQCPDYNNNHHTRQQHSRRLHIVSGPKVRFPKAFLFEASKVANDELLNAQLELPIVTQSFSQPGSLKLREQNGHPLQKQIEFHLIKSADNQLHGKRSATYTFKTKPDSPFFAGRQYVLALRCEGFVRRKITLLAKLDQTLIIDVELDELNPSLTLLFTLDEKQLDLANALEASENSEPRMPQLQLLWRQRLFNFNVLSPRDNEIHLSSVDLIPLEIDDLIDSTPFGEASNIETVREAPSGSSSLSPDAEHPKVVVRYNAIASQSASLSAERRTSETIALPRNHWLKLEGRLTRYN